MQRRIRAFGHIGHWFGKTPNVLYAAQEKAPSSVHNMKAGEWRTFAVSKSAVIG